MPSLSRLLLSAAALTGVLAAPAVAAGSAARSAVDAVTRIDRTLSSTLTADRPVLRSCVDRVLTGRAGVATATFRAPADGVVTVRIAGRAGDWDLALFDRASGRLVASSAAFRASELAQTGMRRGAALTVQACRRSGTSRTVRLTTQFARVDASKVRAPGGRVQLVRVRATSAAAVESMEKAGLDVTHDITGGSANVVLHGDRDVRTLARLGLGSEVLIADLVADERKARAAERAYAARVGASPLPSGRTGYRTFADYQAELAAMVREHPELVRAHTLRNRSFQGRDIQVVEIAEDVRDGDDGRPVFTLGALHHAREWPAAESAMEFAWDLLRNGDTDPRLGEILRKVRVVIMPLTNPDGFVLSRSSAVDPAPNGGLGYTGSVTATGVLLMGGTASYKRKNCNPVLVPSPAVPCEFALGVDPNRNYATKWGGPGASTNPNDQGYRGSAPFSEPETRAVQELSSTFNSPVHVSTHNVAAKVLRPPGLKADGFAPDEDALKALGRLMAEPAGYANEYGWQLYDTTGTTKDWGYDALGQYAYTVEMGPTNGQFHGNYKVHVIDQYLGSEDEDSETHGRGLRESYINAALYTRNEAQTSRLTGRAPAGATLRITKDFHTETYPVCLMADPQPFNVPDVGNAQYCTAPGKVELVPEHVEFTMEVPASGRYTWWMNPSTRPFELRKGRFESYTLRCERDGRVLETRPVTVARGETQSLDLGCGGGA